LSKLNFTKDKSLKSSIEKITAKLCNFYLTDTNEFLLQANRVASTLLPFSTTYLHVRILMAFWFWCKNKNY